MSRPQIIGYINPICGDNSTAEPCDPSLPYESIDFFYNQQRNLDPNAELTAEVQNHLVALDGTPSFGLFYTFLNVTNPSRNARLTIRGRSSESFLFNAVTLQIDTDIVIPRINETMDPIIRTGTDFEFLGSYLFNIVDEEFNPTIVIDRNVFDHDGFTFNDENFPPSRVYIRQARSEISTGILLFIHMGGIVVDINFPAVSNIFDVAGYYITSENIISLNMIMDEQCNINYRSIPIGIKSNNKISPNQVTECNRAYNSINHVTSGEGASIVFSMLGPYAAVRGIIQGGIILFLKSCASRSGIQRSIKQKFKQFKDHPNIKIREKIYQMQNGEPLMNMIQGGTFKNMSEGDFILTNILNIDIVNVNLDHVAPFTEETIQEESDYFMQQNNNSVNYSGSTFQRGVLINSNYTHTQFDGTTFLIDTSNGNITVTIPSGVISNNRYFQYKIIAGDNRVIFVSDGRIEGKKKLKLVKDKCCLGSLLLYGFQNNIFIMNKC